jgi:hypothetical protein
MECRPALGGKAMTMNRREFLAASMAGATLLRQRITLAAQGPVQATIDASTRGEPIEC